jgi:death-on-curing protein
VAFAGLAIFLDINRHRLTCSEVEETGMMLRAAASEITEDEFRTWIERSIAPL